MHLSYTQLCTNIYFSSPIKCKVKPRLFSRMLFHFFSISKTKDAMLAVLAAQNANAMLSKGAVLKDPRNEKGVAS